MSQSTAFVVNDLLPDVKKEKLKVGRNDGAIFDKRIYRNVFSYQSDLAKELKRESELMGVDSDSRVREIHKCSRIVTINVCNNCGLPIAGSGYYECHTCKTRGCLFCGNRRALEKVHWFKESYHQVPKIDGYSWQIITQTIKYDPRNKIDLMIQSLKQRAFVAKKISKKLWEKVLKKPGSAAYRTIEIGVRGHVHCNFVYFGPELKADEISAFCQKIDSKAGMTHLEIIEPTSSLEARAPGVHGGFDSDIVDQVSHRIQYISKGVTGSSSVRREEYLAGEAGVEVIDPKLAARWDLATRNLALTAVYGSLRSSVKKTRMSNESREVQETQEIQDVQETGLDETLNLDEDLNSDEDLSEDNYTCECGCSDFSKKKVETDKWVRYCHINFEKPGFEKGQWNQRIGWKQIYVDSC